MFHAQSTSAVISGRLWQSKAKGIKSGKKVPEKGIMMFCPKTWERRDEQKKKKKGCVCVCVCGGGGVKRKVKSNAQDNLRRKRGWEKEITESDESVFFCYFSFSNQPKHTRNHATCICSIPLILLLGFELHSLNIVGFESSVFEGHTFVKRPLPSLQTFITSICVCLWCHS